MYYWYRVGSGLTQALGLSLFLKLTSSQAMNIMPVVVVSGFEPASPCSKS